MRSNTKLACNLFPF